MALTGSPVLRNARSTNLPEFDAYPTYNFLDMDFAYGKGAKLLDKSSFRTHGDITTATWAAGLRHYSLDFNSATPDYVEVTAPQLDFTSENFSFIFRIKLDSIAAANCLYERGNFNADGFLIRVGTNGAMNIFTSQSGAFQEADSDISVIGAGTWYTVGISRNAGNIYSYVDGIDKTSSSAITAPASANRTAKIAIREDKSTSPADGKIEFLRIFGGIALPATAHLWFHNMLK